MPFYYPYYYYGFNFSDPLYAFSIVLLIVALVITIIAQAKVKSTFAKFSKVSSVLTGAEAAEKLLASQGITNVKIERVSGNLTDHFDPRTNVIRLSEDVYDKNYDGKSTFLLHCKEISFVHPYKNIPVNVESDLPYEYL